MKIASLLLIAAISVCGQAQEKPAQDKSPGQIRRDAPTIFEAGRPTRSESTRLTCSYLLPGVSQPDGVPVGMFFMNASTAWIWPP